MAVQRGNAASVLGTAGQMTPLTSFNLYINFLTFFLVCLFVFEFYLLIFFVHVHILCCFSHPFGLVCVCVLIGQYVCRLVL